MILKELVRKFEWNSLEKRMEELYPDMKENLSKFEIVLNELKKLKMEEPEENITIIVENFSQEKEGEIITWFEVTGFDPENEYYYGISMMPWEKWLGMEINQKSIEEYSLKDLLVHILWEMTYYGFTQEEIREIKEQLSHPVKGDEDYEVIELKNGLQIEVPKRIFKESYQEIESFVSKLELLSGDDEELLQLLKDESKKKRNLI
ncbi:MAG: hypothetical protein FK731_09860 [Asgard group archaeon]|nr:hypothetical protein [Asgard group archaeon]